MLLTTTDGIDAWARNRRSEQLARKERDWAALTTALGTAKCCKMDALAGVLFDATAHNDQHE